MLKIRGMSIVENLFLVGTGYDLPAYTAAQR